jgi:membrane protease subunit HflC
MLLSSTVFVVDQRRYAIVFALGEVREVIKRAGPALQAAAAVPERGLPRQAHADLDTPDAERFITAEKKNILVDAFVKWRIVEPRLYYVAFGGDERRARDRMSQIVKAALNAEITKRTVREVISGQRGKVMAASASQGGAEAPQIGVEIVDVRLKRVDLRRADQQLGVRPHEGRAHARGQRDCVRPVRPIRRRSAPTPTASAA